MIFGPYPAAVARVVDGDTIDLDVDLGFDLTLRQRIRLFGCNAPEVATDQGKAAKAWMQRTLTVGLAVTLVSHGWDKYGGRCDGEIRAGTTDIAAALIAAGYAKPWDGKGPRP